MTTANTAQKESLRRTDFNNPDGIESDALSHAGAAASCFNYLHYSVSVATEKQILRNQSIKTLSCKVSKT
jgi:hypothetical protein